MALMWGHLREFAMPTTVQLEMMMDLLRNRCPKLWWAMCNPAYGHAELTEELFNALNPKPE